jgi:hypothetical protein
MQRYGVSAQPFCAVEIIFHFFVVFVDGQDGGKKK